jgi:hypothetical protein
MRVERFDQTIHIEPARQTPVIAGPSLPAKDSIDHPVPLSSFRSFLQTVSKLLSKFKAFILSFCNCNHREESPEPQPPPPPTPHPEPIIIEEKPVEERKKDVIDDLTFIQGYDIALDKQYHLFRFKGKELVKIFLDQEIHLDHFIHPEDVPCITVVSASEFPKEITVDQLKKIKTHLMEYIRSEESRRMAKVRLVVLNYKSPLIDILKEPFKCERKFKKAHKEFTIFKIE